MAHVIEPAASGRAKCRACGRTIAKGELRFGERLPNPFGEGDMTLWFHMPCVAYARPEPFLELLPTSRDSLEHPDRVEVEARRGLEHRRLPRLRGASRAPTGRAKCRSCHESIEKGSWRIALEYYEEGRFEPSGFVHAGCAVEYTGCEDLLGRVVHFSDGLTDEDRHEIAAAMVGSR